MDNIHSKANRSSLPALLAKKYKEQYYLAAAEFPPSVKIDLVEHLLSINNLYDTYSKNPELDLETEIIGAENNFINKHGKIAKVYAEQKMTYFYGSKYVLAEKEIFTTEEWNKMDGDLQVLDANEMQRLRALIRNHLYYDRQRLWLEQSPDYLTTQAPNPQNPLASSALKAAEEAENKRRKALDKATVLSQEQSVLLLHYLKEIKVFLREHNLNNKDAGIAFGILTGYSHDTIRQKIGKIEPLQTYENLEFLYNYTVRLQKAIDQDLKKLEKPE